MALSKVVGLLFNQFSRPVANGLSKWATKNPKLCTVVIRLAQRIDSTSSKLKKLVFGVGKVKNVSGQGACSRNAKPVSAEDAYSRQVTPISDDDANSKQAHIPPRDDNNPRQVKRLSESEENAINMVAKLLVEVLVFGIATILCIYEYKVNTVRGEQKRETQRISDNSKHAKTINEFKNEVRFKIMEIDRKLESLESFTKTIDDILELNQAARIYPNIGMNKTKDPNNPNNLMISVTDDPPIPTPNYCKEDPPK